MHTKIRDLGIWVCIFVGAMPLCPPSAGAQEISGAAVPSGMGVNAHTYGGFPVIPPIQNDGFKILRTNLYWNHIESAQKGVYDWSKYDQLVRQLDAAGMRPLFELSFSNPLYEPVLHVKSSGMSSADRTAPPIHPASTEAFAAFAAKAAERYKNNHVIWEIWNEPNYYYFWAPTPDGADYARVATAVCHAIKKADPKAVVIAPGAAGTPTDEKLTDNWWRPFLQNMDLACLDGVSVHPYVWNTNKGPEINIEKYDNLRTLLGHYTDRKLPIVSSEFGFSTTDWNISPERQAALFVRNYAVNLLAGVPVSIWYDWMNDGTNPKQREQNFGILSHEGVPRPAYFAAKTLAQVLDGYTLERRLSFSASAGGKAAPDQEKDFILLFTAPQKPPVLMAWSTVPQTHGIAVPTAQWKISSIEAVTIDGRARQETPSGDVLTIQADETPQYFILRP